MSKVILHNGRCGSTYIYLALDRYYRAKQGDNTLGSFESIYERSYNCLTENYIGLNDYLVPEVIGSSTDNNKILLWSIGNKKIKGLKNISGMIYPLMNTQDSDEKRQRRKVVNSLLKTHNVLLKYPLLTNPTPKWDVDYISCERRGVRAQTKSLILSVITGCYHFKPGDERKIKRLKKFGPRPETLEHWTQKVEKSWEVYRSMKPKRCQTLFMEDFQDLKPFEVLELIGIMDWGKYLDKDFDVPIRKAWSL